MKSISNSTRGIIYIIISAFCFALMAVFVRLSGNIHFIQKAFFRNSIAFIIALIFLIKEVNQNGKTIIIFPKICWCGKKATYNARLDGKGNVIKEGEQIVLGANDKYIGLCRKHWAQGKTHE